MFRLSVQDIHPSAHAENKEQAIRQLADALIQAGCVADGYVNGMLARELQTSTWIGNGIAIPHGTTDTRDQVLKTGVQVFQFPQGVPWGENHTAWLVIGIAARSEEHLELLRQLTHALSDESLEQKLKTATSAEELLALLHNHKPDDSLKFDQDLLSLSVAANDLVTLQALNAGRLNSAAAVDASFISHVMAHQPANLGQGIWLNDSPAGNLLNAVAISRPLTPFEQQGQAVAMLVTVAVINDKPVPILNRLSQLLSKQQASRLLNTDAVGLLSLLSEDDPPKTENVLTAEFIIRNSHGLHARPGALLVNTIKQFSSEISVANLQGSGQAVNGRSLMKLVALGVKQGHTLRFSACGEDASEALQAIGKAIHHGLGEGEKHE